MQVCCSLLGLSVQRTKAAIDYLRTCNVMITDCLDPVPGSRDAFLERSRMLISLDTGGRDSGRRINVTGNRSCNVGWITRCSEPMCSRAYQSDQGRQHCRRLSLYTVPYLLSLGSINAPAKSNVPVAFSRTKNTNGRSRSTVNASGADRRPAGIAPITVSASA